MMSDLCSMRQMTANRRSLRKLKSGLDATADYDIWLAPFDKRQQALWAADCAERVLVHFESLHLDDERPRKAIEAARLWARGGTNMMPARAAAVATHAAARESMDPASVAAARAAGHAAATAHSIRHARGAAAYAIVSVMNAATPEEGETVAAAERDWQLDHLPRRPDASPHRLGT